MQISADSEAAFSAGVPAQLNFAVQHRRNMGLMAPTLKGHTIVTMRLLQICRQPPPSAFFAARSMATCRGSDGQRSTVLDVHPPTTDHYGGGENDLC